MNESVLRKALEQMRTIADEALKGSGTGTFHKMSKEASAKAPAKEARSESLPDHILKLREGGFFAQPKTYNEAHAKLQSSYSCDTDRVKVACKRLQRRKLLRKASKLVGKKSQVAYVW